MNKNEKQLKIDNEIKSFKPQKVEEAYIPRASVSASVSESGGGLGGGGNLSREETLIKQLEERIESLERRTFYSEKLNEVFDTAPTYIPKTFKEQFALYKNGAEYRLYVYISGSWKYEILT